MKKILTCALICSQFMIPFAGADTSATTPEETLFASAIALTGEKIPTDEARTQLKAMIAQYQSTAPVEGRLERTEQALVNLGIDTPEQAHALVSDASVAGMDFANQKFQSESEAKQAFNVELSRVLTSSQGAQFSLIGFAEYTCTGDILFGLASAGVFVGANTLRYDTSSVALQTTGALVMVVAFFGMAGSAVNAFDVCSFYGGE